MISRPRSDASIVRHGEPSLKAYCANWQLIMLDMDRFISMCFKEFLFSILIYQHHNVREKNEDYRKCFDVYSLNLFGCCNCYIYVSLISLLNMTNNLFCHRIDRRECLKDSKIYSINIFCLRSKISVTVYTILKNLEKNDLPFLKLIYAIHC